MKSFNRARRRVLGWFGLGAAGAAAAVVAGSRDVFARQFVCEATRVDNPKMVYDPELQQMVDPVTRAPVYGDVKSIKVASGYPTITAGCSDCPKKDDDGE